MTTPTPPTPPIPPFGSEHDDGLPPFERGDDLDLMLREWHETNRVTAAAGRDRLLTALRAEAPMAEAATAVRIEPKPGRAPGAGGPAGEGWRIWRIAPLAAAAVLALALVAPFMLPPGSGTVASAKPSGVVMCPDGGRLEAYDAGGTLLGACILRHTDVAAEITGHVARVTLTQTFENPHAEKIEAQYTFPMSHRGAVDRMSMSIGDRVIVGEVKERDAAREIYEHARDAGLVAGLTEQERPNIFTQSVANIEPGATVAVTLSYVEFVEEKDGEFSFAFPTVVAPRYIPGSPMTGERVPGLPADLRPRRGLVLQGPASIRVVDRGPGFSRSYREPDAALLAAAINGATPIEAPAQLADPERWLALDVEYADGVVERGAYYDPSAGHIAVGHIGGRWYALPTGHAIPAMDVDGLPASGAGAAFAPNTDQVRDAARITPMPVRPGSRSGQDISISVKIDTGGPGISWHESPLHRTVSTDVSKRADGLATAKTFTLERQASIPNRDFVLKWRQTAEGVSDQFFTHTGKHGNFFGLMLRPPARVDDSMAVAREMIFVLDTSGSMNGFPIEKSKELMERALSSMRAGDTFNVITFAGATSVLWPAARPVTEANLAEARALVSRQSGRGGTEMMTAINAALAQPAGDDGRQVRPLRIVVFLTDGLVGNEDAIIDAVKRHRGTTRVFSFGVGNSVNRFLLDSIATEGGGAAEYVLLESDASAAIERLTRRTLTPVLTDIRVEFSDNLSVLDIVPPLNNIPDLFDEAPVTILGRYTRAGSGTVTLRGMTAAGPWERTVTLSLPESQPAHDTIATMWARGKIDQIKGRDLRGVQNGTIATELKQEIIRLGEQFGIMSEYTSFVAVDKLRVTIAGRPRLINVPIELPAGTNFEGFFGLPAPASDDEQLGRGGRNWYDDVPAILTIDQAGTYQLKQNEGINRGDASGNAVPAFASNMAPSVASPPSPPAPPAPPAAAAAPAPRTTATPAPADAKTGSADPYSAGTPVAARPNEPAPSAKPAAADAEAHPTASRSQSRHESDALRGGTGGSAPAQDAAKAKGEPAPPSAPAGASPGAPGPRQAVDSKKSEAGISRNSPREAADGAPPRAGKEAPQRREIQAERKENANERLPGGQGEPGRAASSELRLSRVLAEQERARGGGGNEILNYPYGAPADRDGGEAATEAGALGVALRQQVSVVVAEPQKQTQSNWIVPVQQVALRVGQLANEKQIDQARVLACDLAKAAPEYEVGREMCLALNEVKAPPEAQSRQVAELADRARVELELAARQIELRRKLDSRLLVFATGTGPMSSARRSVSEEAGCSNLVSPDARSAAAQTGVVLQSLAKPPGDRKSGAVFDKSGMSADAIEQGVLVTVLVTGTDPAVLEQLKAAGMMVEDVQAKAKVVVGVVPVGRLAEFALLECVRRVEPTAAE